MNPTFFWITILLCQIGLSYCIFMLYRNERVAAYRQQVLQAISTAASEDAHAGREWEWRYEAFEAVTYAEMLNKFWRPLDSFYKDKSFMKSLGGTNGHFKDQTSQ